MARMKWKIGIPDTVSDVEVICHDDDIRDVNLRYFKANWNKSEIMKKIEPWFENEIQEMSL